MIVRTGREKERGKKRRRAEGRSWVIAPKKKPRKKEGPRVDRLLVFIGSGGDKKERRQKTKNHMRDRWSLQNEEKKNETETDPWPPSPRTRNAYLCSRSTIIRHRPAAVARNPHRPRLSRDTIVARPARLVVAVPYPVAVHALRAGVPEWRSDHSESYQVLLS
jgi:hypothetical protein